MITYYVVQPYILGKKGMLIADRPRQATDLNHCKILAERASHSAECVVAFSRKGEPEFGDWEDAVIVAQYGAVPDEILEMVA